MKIRFLLLKIGLAYFFSLLLHPPLRLTLRTHPLSPLFLFRSTPPMDTTSDFYRLDIPYLLFFSTPPPSTNEFLKFVCKYIPFECTLSLSLPPFYYPSP